MTNAPAAPSGLHRANGMNLAAQFIALGNHKASDTLDGARLTMPPVHDVFLLHGEDPAVVTTLPSSDAELPTYHRTVVEIIRPRMEESIGKLIGMGSTSAMRWQGLDDAHLIKRAEADGFISDRFATILAGAWVMYTAIEHMKSGCVGNLRRAIGATYNYIHTNAGSGISDEAGEDGTIVTVGSLILAANLRGVDVYERFSKELNHDELMIHNNIVREALAPILGYRLLDAAMRWGSWAALKEKEGVDRSLLEEAEKAGIIPRVAYRTVCLLFDPHDTMVQR